MGQRETQVGANREAAGFVDEIRQGRFAKYFPKVFAYVHSCTLDEARSREIVIEAFARTFSRRADVGESDFAVVLFSVARDLCSGARSTLGLATASLTDPEREVLALLFDAQLTRHQVGSLLKMPEESVVTTLVRGLRKQREPGAVRERSFP